MQGFLSLPSWAGLSHMTELSRTLIGRGLVQSLSRSSLRTQGPITPGLKSEKRSLLECRSKSPRRMGPCVRRNDLLENSICDGIAEGGRVGANEMSLEVGWQLAQRSSSAKADDPVPRAA